VLLRGFCRVADGNSGENCNCVVILGPTAVGKTDMGVQIALQRHGEVLSADSRQVYTGLDIGSGKDIADYTVNGITVPYHLIDITDLTREYNVFNYQQDFYRTFQNIADRRVLPVIVGGTGMYLDSVIRNYDLITVPENPVFHARLENKTLDELGAMLLALKPDLHTHEDLFHKDRCIRAIEIAEFMKSPEAGTVRNTMTPRPDIRPLVIGTTLERTVLRDNISRRLRERLESGMIDEVRRLHEEGASWERLENLGLEYKFVSEFLEGKVKTKEELYEKLNIAIRQFAKRQETWFRGMEKKGVVIHWLPPVPDKTVRVSAALTLVDNYIKR
jgi:tRNA dimethylallyltransferase